MTQWGLDTLFNPAKRHVDEEKQRLQSTREEIGDSSGGRRIDLESGKVRIERKPSADASEPKPSQRTARRAAAERAAQQEVARREAVQRDRAKRGKSRSEADRDEPARKSKSQRDR